MKIVDVTADNVEQAWTLFQALMVEQETQKFVTIDFEDFKNMFLQPQLSTVKGLIGIQDGTPMALVTYCYSFTVYRAQPVLTFKTFYVLPNHRKSGYGRQILKYLSEEAEKQNCAYVQWSVYDENEGAKSYYNSMELNADSELLNYLVSPNELKEKIGS